MRPLPQIVNISLAEAEYATKLNKCVIPLKLQKSYEADGWLGFIMGNKFFFDLTKEKPKELNKLLAKLLQRIQKAFDVKSEDYVDGPVIVNKTTRAEDTRPLRVRLLLLLLFNTSMEAGLGYALFKSF